MTVETTDLRSMLDLENIIAADILVCSRFPYQNGAGLQGGSPPHASLLDCLLGQKQKVSTSIAKSLPMGVIVEIGRALDMETRMNLMLANKLFMDAFAKEERDATRREYATQSLADMWHSLMGKATEKNYSMFFEFNSDDIAQHHFVRLDILPGKVRFIVDLAARDTLTNLFPLAEGIADEIDNEYIIGIKVAGYDDFSSNEAAPESIVDATRRLTFGMQMLAPAAYARNPSWLKKVKKLMGFSNPYQSVSMKPVFDKLALFHIAAEPPLSRPPPSTSSDSNSNNNNNNTNNNQQRINNSKPYLTTSQAIAAAKNGTIYKRIRQLN
jgi:hypothetical protein